MNNKKQQLIQMFMDAKYDRENPSVLAEKAMKLLQPKRRFFKLNK